jgi:hypothetical protein
MKGFFSRPDPAALVAIQQGNGSLKDRVTGQDYCETVEWYEAYSTFKHYALKYGYSHIFPDNVNGA